MRRWNGGRQDRHGLDSGQSTSPVTVLFFARVKDISLLSLIEFYREDIEILRNLGYIVDTESAYRPAATSDADLLYAWWGATALPVIIAWRLRGKRCIVTGATGFRDPSWPRTDASPSRFRARTWVRKLFTVWASKLAHKTLAISEFELADLRKAGVQDAQSVSLSADVEYFVPGERSPNPTATTIGQCNLGSILRKGIDVSIGATALVRKEFPYYRLTIAGPVDHTGEAWFAEARKRLDFAGVDVLGEVSREEKRALLQASWLYLQPSSYEGFGLAVAEAMACGAVPIVSDRGSLPEVIGGTGQVIKERTAEELANAIIRLLRGDEHRTALAEAARSHALTFDRSERLKKLSEVCVAVLMRPISSGTRRI